MSNPLDEIFSKPATEAKPIPQSILPTLISQVPAFKQEYREDYKELIQLRKTQANNLKVKQEGKFPKVSIIHLCLKL